MPKIVLIKKENKRYNLGILDDNQISYFKITEDLLIEMRFLSLKDITKEEYLLFLSKIPLDSMIYTAINYLNKRQKSEKEIREYLFDKTNSINLINQTVEYLKNKGYLNDELYFKNIVDYLIYTKREGILKINEKLKEIGLSGYINYPNEALKDNIQFLLKKYSEKCNGLDKNKAIEKSKRFLLGKGYTLEQIEKYFDYSLFKNLKKRNISLDLEKFMKKYDDKKKIKLALYKLGYTEKEIMEVFGSE